MRREEGALVGVVIGMSLVAVMAIAQRCDFVITNVRIFDGTSAFSFAGELGVVGDRIAFVRRAGLGWPVLARTRVDGRGLDLAPGLIDSHSHADTAINRGRPIIAENFVRQGVTTMIVGNCGGLYPAEPSDLATEILTYGAQPNLAALAGYNSLRRLVMDDSTTAPTLAEMRRIARLTEMAMRAGAVGLSTGFPYGPGPFVSRVELLAVLKTVAVAGGIHASHVRDEGSSILESVKEVLDISRDADVPLVVSHLKISGPANCRKATKLFELLTGPDARALGAFADQYPYAASSSSFDLYLPDWFKANRGRRRDAAVSSGNRARLKASIKDMVLQEGFTDLDFMRVAAASRREWRGRSIAEIDRDRVGPQSTIDSQLDVVVDLLGRGGAQIVYHNLCGDVLSRASLQLPVMIGSDSTIRVQDGSVPHPRGWGTFPRVLAQATMRGDRALAIDINRMTALPADVFRLEGRGRLRRGGFADLVLFDRDRVADRATFAAPFEPPKGILAVWVNGARVSPSTRRDVKKRLPGRFLRRSNAVTRPASLIIE